METFNALMVWYTIVTFLIVVATVANMYYRRTADKYQRKINEIYAERIGNLEKGMGTHIGIRLRVSIPAGTVFEATSDQIHLMQKYAGTEVGKYGEVIKTVEGLIIEAAPVILPNEYPDPDYETDYEIGEEAAGPSAPQG